MPYVYFAIGPNCWGKGDTKKQAIARARINWPTFFGRKAKDENFSVYELDSTGKAYVDDFGSLHYDDTKHFVKLQTSKLVIERT